MVDGARYRLAPHSSPGIVFANSLQPKRNLADRGTLKIHEHPVVVEFLCLPLLASLVITDIVSSFAADAARHSRTRPRALAPARQKNLIGHWRYRITDTAAAATWGERGVITVVGRHASSQLGISSPSLSHAELSTHRPLLPLFSLRSLFAVNFFLRAEGGTTRTRCVCGENRLPSSPRRSLTLSLSLTEFVLRLGRQSIQFQTATDGARRGYDCGARAEKAKRGSEMIPTNYHKERFIGLF